MEEDSALFQFPPFKIHCIVTTLNRLFKIEFERGGGTGKEPKIRLTIMEEVERFEWVGVVLHSNVQFFIFYTYQRPPIIR